MTELEEWQILRQLAQSAPQYDIDIEEQLTPDEEREYRVLNELAIRLTAKEWRARRKKLPKRHEQQKWNLLKAYMLSPTQELASQLSQLGFDEIDKALFRLRALQEKKNPMLFAAR